MITTGIIKNLKPCKERFKNYLNHYKNVTFTYAQFMSLDKISFEDKTWVLIRCMTLENMILFAQDIAQCTQYAAQCAQEVAQNVVQCADQEDATQYAQYAQYAAQCAQEAVEDATQYAQYTDQYTQYATRCAADVMSLDFILGLTLKYL